MVLTKKYLVLAIVEENKLSEVATHELEFRDLIESIIRNNYEKYHKRFQFGWVKDFRSLGFPKKSFFVLIFQIGSPEIAHSIAMDHLPTPHLIVLNATTSEHHIPDDDPMQMTPEAIHVFLESIHEQKAPVNFLFFSIFYNGKNHFYFFCATGLWR